MDTGNIPWIATILAHRVGTDADAAQVAGAFTSVLHEIDAALSPILGPRGVAMLFKRSLNLSAPRYPWLAGMHEGVPNAIDFAALQSVLARQSTADAAASGNALLQTFYQLMVSLVGPTLTDRLLTAVWTIPSSNPPTQEPSP